MTDDRPADGKSAHERFPDTHRELPREFLDLAAGGQGGEGIEGQKDAEKRGEGSQAPEDEDE